MMPSVLVVDDHPLVREAVRTMLETRGYVATLAADAAAAITAFQRTRFDVALIDFDIPGLTGVELVRELRRLCDEGHRPFRAALMTGAPRTELQIAAEDAGASCVLAKPFRMAELIATVEQLARHSSPTCQAA